MKTGFCSSGGGAKGSFAVGVASALYEKGKDFQVLSGTSTGALMINLMALEDYDLLRKAYFNVKQEDIFSVNPFKNKSIFEKEKFHYVNMIRSLIKTKGMTFGETKSLRYKTLPKYFPERYFNIVKLSGKKVACSVFNLSFAINEVKVLNELSYNDWLDYVWASCNVLPFMSAVKKNDCIYCDGGYVDYLPVEYLIKEKCTEIHCVVHKPLTKKKAKINNVLDIIVNIPKAMFEYSSGKEVEFDDYEVISSDFITEVKHNIRIKSRKYKRYKISERNRVVIYLYILNLETGNSLVMNSDEMKQLYQYGYDLVNDNVDSSKAEKHKIIIYV